MLTLLHLLSSVALLVWGTHIVRTGIMRVFGSDLRRILGKSINKKSNAFLAGVGVTALVQSSNATALLVISFVTQGLISITPALVIMLGADVGTALMARVLTFDLSWLSPLLILLGVMTFLSRKKERIGQLGRVGIGLGLIILALQLIVTSAETYNPCQCSTSYFYLFERGYDFSTTGRRYFCDGQLFKLSGGITYRNIKCNRLYAFIY